MAAHAKLSASGSSMWLNCPGSIKASEGYKDTSSFFAEEGTLAHEIADQCLKTGSEAAEFIGSTVEQLGITLSTIKPDFVIEEEMTNYVQEYLDYVLSHETADSELFTERRVDYSPWVPGGFGTLDSSILIYSQRILHIFDLKYGKGVVVDAFENTQGTTYGLGMLNDLGFLEAFDTVRIHIVQPRTTPKNFSSWDISVDDLEKFGKYMSERATLALSENAPRVPGDKQCKWCKAKGDCPALLNFTQDTILSTFEDIGNDRDNLPDGEGLTDEQVQAILLNKKLIEDFLGAVWVESQNKLEEGKKVPSFKLIQTTGNRKWSPDAEKTIVRKLGKKKAYTQNLLGLGAAEKLLTVKYVDKLTIKGDPKLVMVHESDKRPEHVVQPIVDQFDEFNDTNEDEF